MAEQINLVGQFTDNITPKLKKLDRELKSITAAFTKLGGKIRPVTKEMGKLAMASERVSNSMKAQRQDITASTQALRAYTTASRKAATQQRKMKPAAMPRASRTPASRGGGGGGAFAAGGTIALGGIGMQLSSAVTSGILKGFDIGVGLLRKPFEFLANGIGERIEDEMSDIKAAGGIYAIAKRMDNPFVKSFAEAESLTKETNRYLAELAGALPGDTQDYINVAKQISDSIGMIISNDREGALRIGRELAERRGEDTSVFDGGGVAATQAAYKELTGELTKQTVLASGGSKMGAMGLPQLTERMISSDTLSTGMFRRYSAVFRDPQIMSALERNIAEINATAKSSSERYEAIQKMYEEVVTPEYVRRVQRSTQGVMEALKTTFMNPEVGLLGLGRPIELAAGASNDLAIRFDQFGRMLDKNNEVTTDVTKAAREALSAFEYLRDIFANVMIVLQPLIESITQLYDPFKELGAELDKIRNATMKFQNVYELANSSLDKVIEGLTGEAKKNMTSTKGMRASLMAVTSAFKEFGVFTDKTASEMYDTLLSENTTVEQIQKMVPEFIDLFLNSAAGAKVGGSIGTVLGKVLKTFADVIVGLFGDASVKNEFVKGFVDGFTNAGGMTAVTDIFNLVFDKIKDLIFEAITNFPKQAALLGGLALAPLALPALPFALSELGPALGAVSKGFGRMGRVLKVVMGGKGFLLLGKKLPIIGAAIAGIAKLFEGGSIFDALSAGGGAAAGAAIGTAIAPGIGTIIGGIVGEAIGGMPEISKIIQDTLGSVWETIGPAFSLLSEAIGGVVWILGKIGEGISFVLSILPGLGKGFNILEAALFAVLSPFRLLELGVKGLYLAFLEAKNSIGLGSNEDRKNIAEGRLNLEQSTDQFRIDGDRARGLSNEEIKAEEYAVWSAAKARGDTDAMNRSARAMQTIEASMATPKYNGGGRSMSLGSAINTEMANKPSGSSLVIANSSEKVIPAYNGYSPSGLGGEMNIGGITVHVSGVDDPREIANQVADEILRAIQKSTYTELYTT